MNEVPTQKYTKKLHSNDKSKCQKIDQKKKTLLWSFSNKVVQIVSYKKKI